MAHHVGSLRRAQTDSVLRHFFHGQHAAPVSFTGAVASIAPLDPNNVTLGDVQVEVSAPLTLHTTYDAGDSDLRTMLAQCAAAAPSLPPPSRALAAILFETSVHHLVEMLFRVSAIHACEALAKNRRSLVQTLITQLDRNVVVDAPDASKLQTQVHMLTTVYKNEVQVLRRSISRFEDASREALKRRGQLHPPTPTTSPTSARSTPSIEKDDLELHFAAAHTQLEREVLDVLEPPVDGVPDESTPNNSDMLQLATRACELEYAVGHARLLQAFFDAKASRREELEMERRRRLVVLKNPPSELPHYLTQLNTELDDLFAAYAEGKARLEAALDDEAKRQEATLLCAMCCVRDDSPSSSTLSSTMILHPTLHSTRIHASLWSKLHAVERLVAVETRLPPTLHQWLALNHAQTYVPSNADAVGAAVAAAVAKESQALTRQHAERMRALEEAHAIEMETMRNERRQRQVRAVLRKWTQTVGAPPPMLELEDDDGPIDPEDELGQDHQAELLAVVRLTRMVARRRAKAAKQRAVAHVAHLTTLQATHKQMLAALANELDCVQSLEHARLMERVKKRRAVRGISHQHHRKGGYPRRAKDSTGASGSGGCKEGRGRNCRGVGDRGRHDRSRR
ncbi:hypothetical protein, variant [Aphanomyces invadans]|uniref:Uncharacterized protein n=1 Tax=Aphanomyces invadans TaxID=157072 RepID=A0A024UVI5_9STRA|nr:hypothetical protein, variant [Aphanomyces invadans]ETW09950.1 hypothetical protein, variant [Aphanomyces invadans]|eukprot:XP_008861361.1 hypothetical protein, variant [Aphanomyces invadans]